MILLWILVPLVPTLVAWLAYYLIDPPSFSDTGMWLAIAALLAGFALLVPSISQIDRHYAKQGCANYARDIGREVRWVEHSYWDYGCYVKTDIGWIVKGDQIEVQQP